MNTRRKKSQMRIYYEKFAKELLENPELYEDETDTAPRSQNKKKTETENEAKTKSKNNVKRKNRNKNKSETKKGPVVLRKKYDEVMEAITNVLQPIFPEQPQSIICNKEGAALYYFSPEKETIEILVDPEVVKEIVEKNSELKRKRIKIRYMNYSFNMDLFNYIHYHYISNEPEWLKHTLGMEVKPFSTILFDLMIKCLLILIFLFVCYLTKRLINMIWIMQREKMRLIREILSQIKEEFYVTRESEGSGDDTGVEHSHHE